MKLSIIRALAIVMVLAAIAGCQSGPRFAWWKREKAPEDTSLTARSAAPSLPSAQSTPQAIAAEGLQPAAPPSSANLAAAGTAAPANASIPAASSDTIAKAPLANYPTANASTTGTATMPAPSAANALTQSATPAPPQVAATTVSPSGPYDPNAYKPSAAPATDLTDSSAQSTPVADRYAIGSGNGYATPPTEPSQPIVASAANADSASSTLPAPTTTGVDRYNFTAQNRYATSPATTPASQTPGVASSASAPTAATTTSDTMTTAPTASATTSATVQSNSTPGQYRPGGTSTYPSAAATQHIEVATRPGMTPSATGAVPQTTAPADSSVPWTPPTSATPAAGPGSRY